MNFSHPLADVFVPDASRDPGEALARVTHLCVGAHPDDIEIMAHAGICDCLDIPGKVFGGVVVTDGAGSPRSGPYAGFSGDRMRDVRRKEQRKAAQIGRYGIQVQLGHPSSDVKQPGHEGVAGDLAQIFRGCRPEVVYLHNPADKHDTHVAVLWRCLEAIRSLPSGERPRRVLGCEVWRDLDWLPDDKKVALDSGRRPELAQQLLAAFDSQISGGKRYDSGTLGRRAANAVFHASQAIDGLAGITWALDLSPLVEGADLSVEVFVSELIGQFRADAETRLRSFGGTPGRP
jgi:LmbE family N-acetylglucosaminyl deacetylase